MGAVAALTGPQDDVDAMLVEFKARRDYLVPALRKLGFDIPVVPQGAFYVYAGCGNLMKDSYAFALDLLERSPEAEVLDALDIAHDEIKKLCKMQHDLREQKGKEKIEVNPPLDPARFTMPGRRPAAPPPVKPKAPAVLP